MSDKMPERIWARKGDIKVEGNLRILCNIGWDIGGQINNISSKGYIYSGGDIKEDCDAENDG